MLEEAEETEESRTTRAKKKACQDQDHPLADQPKHAISRNYVEAQMFLALYVSSSWPTQLFYLKNIDRRLRGVSHLIVIVVVIGHGRGGSF